MSGPSIRLSSDRQYLVVSPGIEAANFRLDSPVFNPSAPVGLALDSAGKIVTTLAASPAPPPSQVQAVYVNKGGNDASGAGTADKPFLTIQRAMDFVTDASQAKVYAVYVGAGTYDGAFAFKPWVGVTGVPSTSGFEGLTTVGAPAAVTFDPLWAGAAYDVAWFSHLTFDAAQAFDIQNTDAQLTFFDCLFNAGAAFTGHHSGNVNNVTWDGCLSYGAVSVTDCQYFFLIGGTAVYGGTVTVTSTSAAFPSATTLLALGGSLSSSLALVSGAGSGGAVGDMRGCGVTGSLTLNGAATQYTSTAEGIPAAVTLAGGAPPPAFYTYAPALGYAPGTPGNWAGPAPANAQAALDRMAALLFANFGPIP